MSQAPDIKLIQTRVNLVKIITAHLPLTESRLVLKGNCPFHADSTHSLMVSPAKNIFKCFGCGIEGGPIEFVMAIHHKKYDEAVKILASGMSL